MLGVVVAIAFGLRFYNITNVPPSLNWDETSIGYNAYSILKTGKDEWGVRFPVHFKSYGEYKLPTQIYFSIPGVAIFGLNELGVRITPIVYGTLTVLLLFFLAKALFKNEITGLISSFFLAISPWHIQLTRASFESSFSVFWIVIGIWFLIKGFQNSKWLLISMIPFAISVYTYNSARVFTPLFLLAILLIYRTFFFKHKKAIFLSSIIFIILMIPLIPFILNHGTARYRLVSITDELGLIPRINENRGYSKLPQPLPKLIHNKVTYVSFYFIRNYLSHFSPQFLFTSGAAHKQHHVQGMGQLYLFQAPFILFGLYLLFKRRLPFKGLFLGGLFISFIPVSVTNDSIPNALRTVIANPFYQMISAFGLYQSYLILRKKRSTFLLVLGVMAIVGLLQFVLYLNNYYNLYPKLYSKDWQYGYKQVYEYINQHKDEYDEIYFSASYGQPYMFGLFYMKYPPNIFQADPYLTRIDTGNFIEVSRMDRFHFVDFKTTGESFTDIKNSNKNQKMLLVGLPGDFPEEIHKLSAVKFLDGRLAFEIVDIK